MSPRPPAQRAPRRTSSSPPALVPRRYLWYREEEGVGKYWFAQLDGKTWTATWGRRGTSGPSKTYVFATAEAAQADFAKKVQSKLAAGYEDSDRGADIAQLEMRDAWRIRPTKRSTLPDQLGGLPPLDPEEVPVCEGCGIPMTLLGLFHADAERLPLGKHAALALFQCESNHGKCHTWDPDAGANAALLLQKKQLTRPQAPSDKTTVLAARSISYAAIREVDTEAEELEAPNPGGSKLGGLPTWVQDEEVPTCDTCDEPMDFVLQLEADDVGANFGDCGVGYAFICRGHGAKFLWQCS